jgi:hypothetical protein
MLEENLVHIQTASGDELVRIQDRPSHMTLTQLQEDGDELVKIENNEKIPLNFRFIQIADEDVELVKMEDSTKVPLNFRF